MKRSPKQEQAQQRNQARDGRRFLRIGAGLLVVLALGAVVAGVVIILESVMDWSTLR